MNKPNVLLLYCDQLNSKYLGTYGHKEVKTPNLDAIAARGVKFTNAYCNNPICTPSRMSLLTGLYPSTHGYYGLYGDEPDGLYSMFKHFKDAGYRTGALGKLHTPRYWVEKECDYVYDEFLDFPKYLEGAGVYEDNDNRFYEGVVTGTTSKLDYENSCEAVLSKLSARFFNQQVEKNEKKKTHDVEPWFAWVSYARPHQPYTPSEPFASMYDPATIELPPTSDKEKDSVKEQRVDEKTLRNCVSKYMGLITQIDHSIGRLIDTLKENGQLDNTIIVFTSDHGDFAGEHGLYSKIGGISYSAITKVPLFFADYRKNMKNYSIDDIIESVDVFPTICDMAGLAIPDTIQGYSHYKLLKNQPFNSRTSALTENAYRKALATKEFRYVSNLETERDELYDIVNDPYELINLIDDERYAVARLDMITKLSKRLQRSRKPYNTINGFWYDHEYDEDRRINLNKVKEINPQW